MCSIKKSYPHTDTRGFHLLWLSLTPLEALRFKHSPKQLHTPWGKPKMQERFTLFFSSQPLLQTCNKNTHKADSPCKTRQMSKTEQWDRLSLRVQRDFKQISLVSLGVCQCSTSPCNRPRGAAMTNKQSCFSILGLQHSHWHSRQGSGSTSLGKTE